MEPAYFETHFLVDDLAEEWPQEFVILSAYATTGEKWPPARNETADRALEAELALQSTWLRRVTGYSPSSGHAEPSWAVDMSFDEACDFGLRFLQDALYHVAGDDLSVSYCDTRRRLIRIAGFRQRLRISIES